MMFKKIKGVNFKFFIFILSFKFKPNKDPKFLNLFVDQRKFCTFISQSSLIKDTINWSGTFFLRNYQRWRESKKKKRNIIQKRANGDESTLRQT